MIFRYNTITYITIQVVARSNEVINVEETPKPSLLQNKQIDLIIQENKALRETVKQIQETMNSMVSMMASISQSVSKGIFGKAEKDLVTKLQDHTNNFSSQVVVPGKEYMQVDEDKENAETPSDISEDSHMKTAPHRSSPNEWIEHTNCKRKKNRLRKVCLKKQNVMFPMETDS